MANKQTPLTAEDLDRFQSLGIIDGYAKGRMLETITHYQEREAEIRSELGQIRHVLAGFVGEITDPSVPIIGAKDSWLGRVQERIWAHRRNEAEKDALIERMNEALNNVMLEAEKPSCGCMICGNDGGHHKGCCIEPIFDLLRLVQPTNNGRSV